MPTLVVGMFRRNLAIHIPTTSVGMPPIKLRMAIDAALEFVGESFDPPKNYSAAKPANSLES